MRDFILEITYDPSLDDAVQSTLYLTASSGSSSVEAASSITLSAYFDSAENRDEAKTRFDHLDVELSTVERDRADWLDLYQQSLAPILIGSRFVVAPDAALIDPRSGRLAIVVPQEQAFGTGSHETTALCIAALERMTLTGKRGLDIGSGSGILAIAMLRLGAATAIAFDNDLDAYGALRDNRLRNGVPAQALRLFIGSVEALRDGTFDVITMNIIPEVILPLLPEVAEHLEADGSLILSGILSVRRDDVIAAAREQGLRLQGEEARGEWWCGAFSRA